MHPDVLRRTCRGAGAGDARTQDLQDLCGVRRASRHPVELGPDPHHPGIHSAHPLPEPLDAGAVSRLQVQFRGRHHLPMDEGVLSAALRPFAEVYRRGALAHQRRVVECQRPQHAFGRVVHPQHPARTGALQARVRRAFDRHLPARLLRVRVHAAFAGGPLRPDRFLDPEAELAQARLLPRRTLSQEEPLLVGRMVRYRRAVAHGGLRYGRVYRRTAGRRGV